MSLFLGFALTLSSFGAEKVSAAQHLQNISVTIRAEAGFSASEGSGVIFTRKNKDGKFVNLVWTAAHVIDHMRTERKVVRDGRPATIVEFKDPMIVKEIRQDGRIVGRLQMDAEVLKYSDATDGHDLALLRVRKLNFITDSVAFYLDKKIPELGTDLLHVGSLLGQMGANSMTDGIYSQHGRIIKSINKFVYDQTTVTAFPGSSGGGVYLKEENPRYVGMLVRGAGEGFNLIVPIRRMVSYCQKHKIMWALDPSIKMPDYEELKKMPIEATPKTEEKKEDGKKNSLQTKEFPFMIRRYNLKPTELEERIK